MLVKKRGGLSEDFEANYEIKKNKIEELKKTELCSYIRLGLINSKVLVQNISPLGKTLFFNF